MADPETARVDERLKPVLAYVRKLTLNPAKIAPADARRVYEAGWDERALFDAISVCALFNMMNRIVLGAGITEDSRLRRPEEVENRRRSRVIRSSPRLVAGDAPVQNRAEGPAS